MKTFIIKIILFALFSLFIVCLTGEFFDYVINTTGYNVLNNPDHKIQKAIIRSRKHIKTKHLIIGESVSAQLYGRCQDSIVYSMSASVAIRDVGEYLLLSNFFEKNKEQLPDEVIMIFGPTNYFARLQGPLFYGSFMKSFYNSEFFRFMDDSLRSQISKQPLSFLCKNKAYQHSPYLPELGKVQQPDFTNIDVMQLKYLHKIKELCQLNNVKFRLLAGPTKMSRIQEIDSVLTTLEEIDTIFCNYRRTMKYLPDSCYIDVNHMKPRFVPKDYLNLYKQNRDD